MSGFDKKPTDYDPPNIGPDNGGFQPPDPFHIPHTDWNFNPFLDPNTDDPSPYQPKPTDPPVPGGTPKPPSWWQEPPPDLTPPDQTFSPENQAKIKEKHRQEEEERRQREAFKKQLEDEAKKAKQDEHDQWGDFPEPSGDTGNA